MRALTLIRAGAVALVTLCLALAPASAQNAAPTAIVVDNCGVIPLPTGEPRQTYQDKYGRACVSADTVVRGSAVNRSAVVATANASQPMIAANDTRRGWNFQNQTGGICYWKIGGTATQNYLSFRVPDGGYYETPVGHTSTGAVNVICASTTGGYYATEW